MPLHAKAMILNNLERNRANTVGSTVYLKSGRYKVLREPHFFAALDAAVATMKALDVPNAYDGRILGAFARLILAQDPKAIGVLHKRNVAAVRDPDELDELLTLSGILIAEQYLEAHHEDIPAEPPLGTAGRLIDALDGLFEEMRQRGKDMAATDVVADELAITRPGLDDPVSVARALIDDAALVYESVIPATDDGGIPEDVERRSISKAAFLKLTAAELAELAAEEGDIATVAGLPSKREIATVLADRHGQDLEQVARMVINQTEGDPSFGLVTRLMPLREAPDLDAAARALRALRTRYFEPRLAVFFIFGDVTRTGGTLRASGRLRSFTVNPQEAAGTVEIGMKPSTHDVTVTLRDGDRWAEIDTRRSSDLHVMATVLRRTGQILPAAAVPIPDAYPDEPYSEWDPRTLWVLDFLRRDLQAPELKLDDTLMANFLTAQNAQPSDEVDDDDDGVEEGARRVPNLQAVRLLGTQLHEHPEACSRIASCAHLRDIEVRLRKVTDRAQNLSQLVKVRLSWEVDHLAVLSGSSTDGTFDGGVHAQVVKLVRGAADRQLGALGLRSMLDEVQRRASDGVIPQDGSSVLDEHDAQPPLTA
jgi:hypothetical protein